MEESDDEQDKETHRGTQTEEGGGGSEASFESHRNEVKGIVRDEREPKKHIIR